MTDTVTTQRAADAPERAEDRARRQPMPRITVSFSEADVNILYEFIGGSKVITAMDVKDVLKRRLPRR